MISLIPSKLFMSDLNTVLDDGDKLKKICDCIDTLALQRKPDKEFNDHKLYGRLEGFRECIIDSRYHLIYRENENFLVLLRLKKI